MGGCSSKATASEPTKVGDVLLVGKDTPHGEPDPRATVKAAAAALRAAPIQTEATEDGENAWVEYDGAALEPALQVDEELRDSAVRLVDARFLIELDKRGGRLCRRQDLPEEAFVSLDVLRRLPSGGGSNDCLRVMSVSQ